MECWFWDTEIDPPEKKSDAEIKVSDLAAGVVGVALAAAAAIGIARAVFGSSSKRRTTKKPPDNGVTNSYERDMINQREKLKESEEYKRTMEEEWAARRRQVQNQAKEAQRLRKWRKAESKRSDMQRRQKERVKEVRETQKKVEQNMKLREKLRDEITKPLSDLEKKCTDMASLLHSLGIQVGGGLKPSPHEVQAAYRRALLKFHPDKVSKCDIREQVEAEEKFKLIGRMKNKLIGDFYPN